METHKSVADMAANKFKNMLNRFEMLKDDKALLTAKETVQHDFEMSFSENCQCWRVAGTAR